MAKLLKLFTMWLIQWIFAVYYGLIVSFAILCDIIKSGPKTFFHRETRTSRPECMNDPALGIHGFLNLQTGIRIHYVAAGDENKPLMLFLHGFPECWYSWRYQMKAFKSEYRVVSVDMRGYGESDCPVGMKNYSSRILTDDIRDIISELGYSSCVLVAHDWGGAIAWYVAMEYPELVDKLIINNVPHPDRFSKHMSSHWSQFRKSWYMFLFQLPYLPELMLRAKDYSFLKGSFMGKSFGIRTPDMFTLTDLEAMKFSFSQKGTITGAINYYRSALQTKPLRSKPIKCPTILIWGDKDGALEIEMTKGHDKYVDNFTLKIVEGASHWVQQDFPDEVNRIMSEFLKG
ncbi:epoxide hydrolase 4-like [Antedon mediterranea]|uniref:epoxide hydrolase 4-like n=1 Tax=Antedon mediterranea TaxID=105859 RepID=UPI003AF4348E